MNCLDFRRNVDTDPKALEPAAREHMQNCTACAAHSRRIAQFNRSLATALKVPVPENLNEKILLRHSFSAHRAKRSRWQRLRAPRWMPAIAASVLLLLTISATIGAYLYDEAQLQDEVVALVGAAEYALQASGPVATEAMASALKPVGLHLNGDIGDVSFAGRCLVRGKLSGHIVLRDRDNPITVFLMPNESVVRQTYFEGQKWSGVLVPTSKGAIAIVAPRGQALKEVTQRILDALHWNAA